MANNEQKIVNVLRRNGTDQLDRNQQSLLPESVHLQGFGLEQWMEFAYKFAEKVNYFPTTDDTTPSGKWQSFFATSGDLKAILEKVKTPDGEMTPHLTLFLCFLQLMELSTKRINKLTKRHLDFYYKEILKMDTLPEQEDKAYILFELAKTASSFLVKSKTELDGGKDGAGKKRTYQIAEELPATKTTVAQIKNVYNEHNIQNLPGLKDEDRFSIKAAPIANSIDGIGGKLTEESPTWYPFGYFTRTQLPLADPVQEELPGMTELPDARLGFAIAAPILRLSEGSRRITFTFSFANNIPATLDVADFEDLFTVYFTGAKGWITPIASNEEEGSIFETTDVEIQNSQLKITVILNPEVAAVTDYVKEIHGEAFSTTAPVARFLLAANDEASYGVYSLFAGKNDLKEVLVDVLVEGAKNLVLQNDTGVLNAEKPFYPFTTQPVKGSAFTIYNAEAAVKKWTSMTVNWKWKSTPLDFAHHYAIYDSSFLSSITKEKFENIFEDYDPEKIDKNYFDIAETLGVFPFKKMFNPLGIAKSEGNTTEHSPIVTNNSYFKATSEFYHKEKWILPEKNQSLFKLSDSTFTSEFSVNGNNLEQGYTGPIRILLEQSFLHEMFPSLYAISLSGTKKSLPVPNEPYTPFAEEITMSYEASEKLDLVDTDEADFEKRSVQLFHEHPFGQSEEHAYLKKTFAERTLNCSVFPTYCKGGEIYIGLANAQVSELVTLLFQVAEGTENPLAGGFVKPQKVQWDILCNNVWRSLDSTLMVLNEIDNFLLSGRIKFTIPTYATSDNTVLPGGLFWIRGKMFKRYDEVCRLHGVHAQAALAAFDNRDNDLSHLRYGLPAGSITKLVERVSQVKSIQQPYATFGGKPEESDALYYRRVSERLRHKNRAITIWDYEHLILQEFPEIYKAKCLNHTYKNEYTAPGCVTLVVIPDTVNKTVFDIYQPRVSQGTLGRIDDYLNELNSMHVTLEVINPEYEEVEVTLGAQFYKGLDFNTYARQLEKDITRYLSPWAFENAREIKFGVILYRSSLIHYIEKLDYVDYVEDVSVSKEGVLQPRNCSPANPKSILVSAKTHKVIPVVDKCAKNDNSSPVKEETCQL